jgi:hypothetical protein
MTEQGVKLTLQSVPDFKKAYDLCVACKITDKLSPHMAFIEYVDTRARRKIASASQDYKSEHYFPALKAVIRPYVEQLEKGDVIKYEAANGSVCTIDIREEFRRLKEKVENKATDYLTWTIAKLREILVLKGSSIKISHE